ncbi:hypothetical protein CDAR_541051 [Caerostris darwini]|uniref:Uncharacterized protein n=1 Tax=Caerostris darwini TaxID=1538125 RepID=A0AAV4VJ33_9ARAC|nr:hypothetical protein CDAR_541051 [Caerostris darwini]
MEKLKLLVATYPQCPAVRDGHAVSSLLRNGGVMIYCLDPGTIQETEEIEFDGQNWEESIKNEKPAYT